MRAFASARKRRILPGAKCTQTEIADSPKKQNQSKNAEKNLQERTLDLLIQPQHDGALRWDCRSQSAVGVNSRGIINLRYRRTHEEIAMDRSRRSSCDQQKFWCANPHSICCSRANRASDILEYSMVSDRKSTRLNSSHRTISYAV